MTTFNDYFDRIFCINLDRRTDRWAECLAQFDKFHMTVERFSGHDLADGTNRVLKGCSASHRGCLELIRHHHYERALILEDDFQIIQDDAQELFSDMIGEVPKDWDMLYLGGHYAEKPQYRVSPHVIRIGRMMTTSSYAVTWKFASSKITEIEGLKPPDVHYYENHLKDRCYIFQPRLMVQRPGYSDLQRREDDNSVCMKDTNHENMV